MSAAATQPAPCSAAGKVLIVTFQYPPGHETGTLRPLKFSRYLGEFGWEPSILTVTPHCYESRDQALLREVPAGITVHQVRCFDAKRAFAVRGRYPGFLAVPDRYASWLPFGVARGLRAARRARIDVLLSTSPTATAHLIAMCIARLTGIPWVADFRDPWGADLHGAVRRRVERRLERLVIRRADWLTATTPEIRAYYEDRYGGFVGDKTTIIYNGYDESDFEGIDAPARAAEGTVILHSGCLYPDYRSPEPFLRGLRAARAAGTVPNDLGVVFLGGGDFAASAAFRRVVSALGLDAVVRCVPRLPYRDGLQAIAAAPVLLLLQGGDEVGQCIPNKAFEYLRVGRPILTVAPAESATARFMRQFEGVLVSHPTDEGDIAAKLAEAVRLSRTDGGALRGRQEQLARYSRRGATAQLAAVLAGVTATRPGAAAPARPPRTASREVEVPR